MRDLTQMLELRAHDAQPVEIVRTVATAGKGIDELANAAERHRERESHNDAHPRHRRRAEAAVREHALDQLRRAVDETLATRGELVDRVTARGLDPYSAADELVQAVTARLAGK